MKRLLLYVHFNKYNRISPYVYYQLEQMRPLFSKVVFISNSKINTDDYDKMIESAIIDSFIQRDNTGFDFAAWRDGLVQEGFKQISKYDNITLMNDTCFGPIWDIQEYYQKFEADDSIDFWGMTNHRAGEELPEHIQSYFISYKQTILSSPLFEEYWSAIEDLNDVQEVIDRYEANTTANFVNAGFKYGVVFDTVDAPLTNHFPPNFSLYHPTALLQHRVPLFKVKITEVHNGIAPYLLDFIDKESNYPVDLMITHLSDIYFPDESYKLSRKYLGQKEQTSLSNKKIAVHLHVFYVDLLEEFLDAFKAFHFDYDLFITVDSVEKKSEVEAILESRKIVSDVYVLSNVGRDIFPMLQLKDKLSSYDYIGHFHTKKSKEADFWAGESWRKELITMMIDSADNILWNFEEDSLGLVIADIPTFFRFNKIVDAWNESLIAPEMNRLWTRMKLTKVIDFENFQTFVMSYGTFIWFKYDALKPLFELDLKVEEIPEEPLPQNSVLHAIERLLVYISWDRHYDFRIVPNPVILTPFIDNKLLNLKQDNSPQTVADFNQIGGVKPALRMIFITPFRAIKYLAKKTIKKLWRVVRN